MTFVDRIFLNWVSGPAMAAAFAASMLWFLFLCLPLGICAYANTFVAQYAGNRQERRIGRAVWQAIWVALFFLPLTPVAMAGAPWIFAQADHPAEVQLNEVVYFQSLCWGGVGMLVAQAAASFYSGRGKTRVVMWVDTLFALMNVVLDYVWIFGLFGFPEMGAAGAGYATSCSLWLKAIAYVWLMLRPANRLHYSTWQGACVDWALMWRLLRYGGPSGLQMLLDVVGFTVFVMLIGRLGASQAEATSMAFSISTLAFMPIWGFGMAAGILVGQRLGENHAELAERATWTTLVIAIAYMACISTLYVLVPNLFLFGFFATDQTLLESVAVRELAVNLLRFVAAYNLFDAGLIIFSNAIKGAGDTQFVLWVSLVMGTALAVISYLAVEQWQFGVYGCWMLITGWVWVTATTFMLRFRQGNWKLMRVIDVQPL